MFTQSEIRHLSSLLNRIAESEELSSNQTFLDQGIASLVTIIFSFVPLLLTDFFTEQHLPQTIRGVLFCFVLSSIVSVFGFLLLKRFLKQKLVEKRSFSLEAIEIFKEKTEK